MKHLARRAETTQAQFSTRPCLHGFAHRLVSRGVDFPPTGKPGILDEVSEASEWMDDFKIRWQTPFWAQNT